MNLNKQSVRSVFASVSRYISVPENVRLRVESFGGIAFDKLTGMLIELDRDAVTLLQYIHSAGAVAEDAVITHFEDQDCVAGVLERLFDLGIIHIAAPHALSIDKNFSSTAQPISRPSGPRLTAPETVHWAITYRCDQHCPDCYARRYSSDFTNELDTGVAMRLVNILANWGVFQLAIGGGEPLLWPDLAEICRHAHQNGMVVHVTTGYHDVNKELLHSLAESISVLQIGVKHNKLLENPHIEYSKLSNTIEIARNLGISIGVNLMLSRTVLAHFNELIDILARAGVDRITLLRYKPTADQRQWVSENPSPDVWSGFEQQLRNTISRCSGIIFRVDCALSFLQRNLNSDTAAALGMCGCVAGRRILALVPDGSAYSCSQLIRSDLRVGNLLMDDPDDLWALSDSLRICRTFRGSQEYNRSRCGICGARSHCGGCRAFAADWLDGDPGCPVSI